MTALKHFGPRAYSQNFTGEVVKIGGSVCDRAKMRMRKSLGYRDLEGAIVVFDLREVRCSWETRYRNLREAGAALVLSAWTAYPPGEFYYAHDGSRGRRTRSGDMPMLEIFTEDADDLTLLSEQQRRNGTLLTVRVTPSDNLWLASYNPGSWAWLVLRVLAPIFAFATVALAARNLRARSSFSELVVPHKCTLPSLVLATEALVTAGIGVLVAAGYASSSDALPEFFHFALFLGLGGFSMFTTLVVAPISRQHWRDERDALVHQRLYRLTNHRLKVGFLAVATIGSDVAFFVLGATYSVSIDTFVFLAFLQSFFSWFVSFYFIRSVWRANVDIIEVMLRGNYCCTSATRCCVAADGRARTSLAVQHMIAWLAVSGVFMLVASFGVMLLSANDDESHTPMDNAVAYVLLIYGRIGTSHAQIRSLDPIPSIARIVPSLQEAPESSRRHETESTAEAEESVVTYSIRIGEHIRGIRKLKLPETATVSDLQRAVETQYPRPNGGRVSSAFVGRDFEIDGSDLAMQAIEFGEVVGIVWSPNVAGPLPEANAPAIIKTTVSETPATLRHSLTTSEGQSSTDDSTGALHIP